MKSRDIVDIAAGTCAVLLALAVLLPIALHDGPWPAEGRDLLVTDGYRDTGAENLVSALYLGYRAYDTIGETIVLLVALAGAISLISGDPGTKPPQPDGVGRRARPAGLKHTEIIDAVSGKLAPVVLLFGCYVMLFGHLSPGGGFQGGVVMASGIVFLAIGRRGTGPGLNLRAYNETALDLAEAVSFGSILLLAFSGMFGGGGLTANPIPLDSGIPPVTFIVAMNVSIGLKVGSGVALLCVLMLDGRGR